MIKRLMRKTRMYVSPKPSFIDKRVSVYEVKHPSYKHSFAGYYDRSPDDGENLLFLSTDVDDYMSSTDNIATLCIYNKKTDSYKEIAKTRGWNFQQAAQQQWLDKEIIIYNDVRSGKSVSSICDINGAVLKEHDFNIGLVSNKKTAAVYDYSALLENEHEYGYAGLDKYFNKKQLLYVVDVFTGEVKNSFDCSEIISQHPFPYEFKDCVSWIQHPKFNNEASKMLFVLRSKNKMDKLRSDLFVYDFVNNYMYCALAWEDWRKGGHHPVWYDNKQILMNLSVNNSRKLSFVRFVKFSDNYHVIASNVAGTGHPTLSPDQKYIITDDYPDRDGLQALRLIDPVSGAFNNIADLFSPPMYRGRFGTDLHPRWLNNSIVCIDTTVNKTRSVYLMNLENVMS